MKRLIVVACCLLSTSAACNDRKDADTYFNRGNAWVKKGQWDMAFTDFNEAIRLDPKYAQAYANRAIVYRKMGNHAKAALDEQKAKQLMTL